MQYIPKETTVFTMANNIDENANHRRRIRFENFVCQEFHKFSTPLSRRKKTVISSAILFFLIFTPFFSFAASEKQDDEKFSRRERRWAVKWINRELSFMMGNGVLKKIISRDNVFVVRVGKPWHKLAFNRKGEFLKRLSRARQITGHSPFFQIIDDKTGKIAAKVSEESIEIMLPEEGFFQYLLLSKANFNTFY